jgi:hypothetical protein
MARRRNRNGNGYPLGPTIGSPGNNLTYHLNVPFSGSVTATGGSAISSLSYQIGSGQLQNLAFTPDGNGGGTFASSLTSTDLPSPGQYTVTIYAADSADPPNIYPSTSTNFTLRGATGAPG